MQTYRVFLNPESAFGTPLVGDTLFGQLCWAIVHRYGEARLNDLLKTYCDDKPFMVVSDAFLHNYIPLPCLPLGYWEKQDNIDHKMLKKKRWISLSHLNKPVKEWLDCSKSEEDIINTEISLIVEQPHNTINRITGTTGLAPFSPYMMDQIWFDNKLFTMDLYIVIDEEQFSLDELKQILQDVGQFGYGRDATIGLGKFIVKNISSYQWEINTSCNSYLTLANCAPQKLPLDRENSYYNILTHFGRHGSLQGLVNPYKKPILLAKSGAVFTPLEFKTEVFIGQGVGNISYQQVNAVHQGYCPVIPICLDIYAQG
ncbi:type III-A CRISPR-associated RAMP protein Csm4 [Gallibacterium anatis]|uniref:type III-A CRISPR-associated RAMP protein Csm4 n=1 Tax=Gallibacterium anatis TaxID=750 RepID=UPI003006C693